ncbi:MAG: Gldg family protein [Planctomycetota bacterium]
MATNKSARDTLVLIAVVIAFAVTVMANLLADRKFARIDLTSEGKYSLSQPFRSILARLNDNDPLKITYYVLKDCAPFENYKRDMLDKLNEIKTAANGRIEIEPVDPTDTPELYQRLKKEGFEREISESKKDQISVSRVFSGLEFTYKAKTKLSVPFIWQQETLEYAIGGKIIELTQTTKPIIAVQSPVSAPQMQMMGRQQQGSGFEWLQQGHWDDTKKFDVRAVDLSENNSIPASAVLLILIRPKELNERQRYEVIKYLAGGGKLLLIASSYKVSHEFAWRAERTPTGLEDYLKEIGLTFGPDFVCDNSNLRAIVGLDPFTMKPKYSKNPFFIRILPANIDQESVLTRKMPGLLMPSPSEIRLNTDQFQRLSLKEIILATTSKQSWTVPFTETVNPDLEARYDEAHKNYEDKKNVFVQLDGQFPFPYEGKPVPEWRSADTAAKEAKPETAKLELKPGTLIVCSAPEAFHQMYLEDQTLSQVMQANAALIINIAENVSLGNDLIKLRTKRYEERFIDKLPGSANDRKRNAIKLALIIGVPFLVIIFALLRIGLRRATQIRYERKFAQTSGPSSFTP